jgi:hypothetical protein
MLFSLRRENGREGAEGSEEKTGRGGGRGPYHVIIIIMSSSLGSYHDAERARKSKAGKGSRKREAGMERGAAPDVQRMHRCEGRQTGGEGGGADRTDAIRTARE